MGSDEENNEFKVSKKLATHLGETVSTLQDAALETCSQDLIEKYQRRISTSRQGLPIITVEINEFQKLLDAINDLNTILDISDMQRDTTDQKSVATAIQNILGDKYLRIQKIGSGLDSGGPNTSLEHLLEEHGKELKQLEQAIIRTMPKTHQIRPQGPSFGPTL